MTMWIYRRGYHVRGCVRESGVSRSRASEDDKECLKCRCAPGDLHGPYWYAYWSEGGRTKSQYIGKKLTTKKKRR